MLRAGGLLSPQQINACRADYADHLRLLDDQLHRLLNALDNREDQTRTAVLPPPITVRCWEMETCSTKAASWKEQYVSFIFRPPPRAGQVVGVSSNKPLPLTGLLREVLHNLPLGGAISSSRTMGTKAAWCRCRVWERTCLHPRSSETMRGYRRGALLGHTFGRGSK